MTEVELTQDTLVVHVKGADKIWAFRSQLTIPLTHVTGAEVGAKHWGEWWQGVKFPGANLPGMMVAGSFYGGPEGSVFWDVHHPQNAVTIHLTHEHYTTLVIEVADAAATVAAIEEAVRTDKTA